jgi:hypothetical protein
MPFGGFPVFLLTLYGQPVKAVRYLSQTSAPLQGIRSKNRRQGSENPTYRLAPKAEQGSKAALMSVPCSSACMPESARAAKTPRRKHTARWRSPYSTRSPLTAFLRSQRTALEGRPAKPHEVTTLMILPRHTLELPGSVSPQGRS